MQAYLGKKARGEEWKKEAGPADATKDSKEQPAQKRQRNLEATHVRPPVTTKQPAVLQDKIFCQK